MKYEKANVRFLCFSLKEGENSCFAHLTYLKDWELIFFLIAKFILDKKLMWDKNTVVCIRRQEEGSGKLFVSLQQPSWSPFETKWILPEAAGPVLTTVRKQASHLYNSLSQNERLFLTLLFSCRYPAYFLNDPIFAIESTSLLCGPGSYFTIDCSPSTSLIC